VMFKEKCSSGGRNTLSLARAEEISDGPQRGGGDKGIGVAR